MALIEIQGLSKTFWIGEGKQQQVLKGLNLSLNSGEFTAIIGESGSGKSTLLNIIGGLDTDYEGNVRVGGRSLMDYSARELDDYRRLNIGFIFQSFNLIPTYTVLENILAPAEMTTMPAKVKREKALRLISKLGLSGLEDKPPGTFPVEKSRG